MKRPIFYILGFDFDGSRYIKIGRTVKLSERIKQHKRNNPGKLIFMSSLKFDSFEESRRVENYFKEILKHRRIDGSEWVKVSDGLIEELSRAYNALYIIMEWDRSMEYSEPSDGRKYIDLATTV